MRRGAFALVSLFATLPAVGCGTLVNQSAWGRYPTFREESRPYRVYGGVRTDFEKMAWCATAFARGAEIDPETGEVSKESPGVGQKVYVTTVGTLFWLVDLPLSLVADTVYLPSDLRKQWHRLADQPVAPARPKQDSEVPLHDPSPPTPKTGPDGLR